MATVACHQRRDGSGPPIWGVLVFGSVSPIAACAIFPLLQRNHHVDGRGAGGGGCSGLYLYLHISSMKQEYDDLIQLSKLHTIPLQVTSPDSISLQFMPFFNFPVGSYIGFDSLSSHFHSQRVDLDPPMSHLEFWFFRFLDVPISYLCTSLNVLNNTCDPYSMCRCA
jgi:hypothetical protein